MRTVSHRLLPTVVRALLAVLVAAIAAAVPARPAFAATWTVVPTPNATSYGNRFDGVDAAGTTSAWAVGWAYTGTTPAVRPLTARWNGTAWSSVSTPTFSGDATLHGVDNGWAVGSAPSGPLTQRWNGSAWSVVACPRPAGATGATLRAVKTLAADNAWAVGHASMTTSPFTRTVSARWNGTSWTIIPSPNPDGTQNFLVAVDGVATNDVWAVGNFGHDGYGGGTTGSMVLRWNGSAWSEMALPGFDGTLRRSELTDLVVLASNDVWVVGQAFHFGVFTGVPYWLHWNGQTWQQGTIPNPPAGRFHAVTALSPTRVYAVGDRGNQALIARWNSTGWNQETTPPVGTYSFLVDAAATGTPGTGTVWAVGMQDSSGSLNWRTLAMRATNG